MTDDIAQIVWVAMYSRRTFVSENDGVQIFRPPLHILGVMSIWRPQYLSECLYRSFINQFSQCQTVGVFLWFFQGTELIDNKFKPTGSVFNQLLINWVKTWNPLNVLLFTSRNKDQNLQQVPVRIDQHSAISWNIVCLRLLHYLHCKITIIDSSSSDSLSQISSLIIIIFVQSLP